MAKETIETIRQAELRAEQTEKDARIKAEEIVAKAHEEAGELLKSLTGRAREDAANARKEAGVRGEGMMAQAVKEVEQEVVSLREDIGSKEASAVKMILDGLI